MASTIDPKLTLEQLESLKAWGTRTQREQIEAVIAAGGNRAAAAAALGVSANTIYSLLHRMPRTAAKRGWSPESSDLDVPIAPGYGIKGTSTLYGAEGEVKLRWVKTQAEQTERMEALAAALENLRTTIVEPVPPPVHELDDLLNVYPMGDPHLGMYSWAKETGSDFDLNIATANLFGAVDHLVDKSPPARYAWLLNLGDFFHANGKSGTTAKGTPLDTDSRWPKVVAAGLDLQDRLITRALEKHEFVRVTEEIGNHDDDASIFLALAMARIWRDNPRVTVDVSPSPYHWYRYGKCLLGSTHKPLKDLAEIMAYDRAEDWGQTEHRHFYVGHVHHTSVKEHRGVIIETFRTLAGTDAWHHLSGYRSGRDMRCHTWHRTDGKIEENIVGIKRVIASAKAS